MSESVLIHPIAPHLKDGPKKPHVGPSINAHTIDQPQLTSIGPRHVATPLPLMMTHL
jgi:hypothetical protein